MAKLTYLGHAAFSFEKDNLTFLFDPFLNGNPKCPVKPEEIRANYIFVSHAHADHLGDTYDIAKRTGAKIISTFEVVQECQDRGLEGHPMHVGGKFRFDFGYVRLTPAFHGSGITGGHACGFIVNFNGITLYHAGDTSLFGDMKLFGEIERIDAFIVPIGGNFTMDVDDAVYAVKLTSPRIAIPCHYNTWPVIAADPREFKEKVEKNTSAACHIMEPGDTLEL